METDGIEMRVVPALINFDEYKSVFDDMKDGHNKINQIVAYRLINMIMKNTKKYPNVTLDSLSTQITKYFKTYHKIPPGEQLEIKLFCLTDDECCICYDSYTHDIRPLIICPKEGHCACYRPNESDKGCVNKLLKNKSDNTTTILTCPLCQYDINAHLLGELGLIKPPKKINIPVTEKKYLRFLKFNQLITNNIELFKSYYKNHLLSTWSGNYHYKKKSMATFAPNIANKLFSFVKNYKFTRDENEYLESVNLLQLKKNILPVRSSLGYIGKNVFNFFLKSQFSMPVSKLHVNNEVKSDKIKYIECQLVFMLAKIQKYNFPTEFNYQTAKTLYQKPTIETTRLARDDYDNLYIDRIYDLIKQTYILNPDNHYDYNKKFMPNFLCSDYSVLKLCFILQSEQIYDLYTNTPFFESKQKYNTDDRLHNEIINKTYEALSDILDTRFTILKQFFKNRHAELSLYIQDVEPPLNKYHPLQDVVIPRTSSVFLRDCISRKIMNLIAGFDFDIYLNSNSSNLKKKYTYKKLIENTNELVLQNNNPLIHSTTGWVGGGEKKDSDKWQCIVLGLVITIACAVVQ
jgi:hypothetical protein